MRGIEQVSWLYDMVSRLAETAGLRAWRQWLVEGARGLTLEVGCGTGRNLPFYRSPGRVVGIDRDPHVLRAARRRAPAVQLVRARAEQLPFATGAFSTVVSGFAMCSVDDPTQALTEVLRVLQPDGEFRLMEHVRAEGKMIARLQDKVQPLWTWLSGGCRPNRDTEESVRSAGFVIDETVRTADGTLRRLVASRARA